MQTDPLVGSLFCIDVGIGNDVESGCGIRHLYTNIFVIGVSCTFANILFACSFHSQILTHAQEVTIGIEAEYLHIRASESLVVVALRSCSDFVVWSRYLEAERHLTLAVRRHRLFRQIACAGC